VVSSLFDDHAYALQWRWTGTHNDRGQKVDVRGASIGRVDDDGLVVEHFDYWNPAHIDEQIGCKRN
jgi:hypothetical protein